jgi:hypothetical protein
MEIEVTAEEADKYVNKIAEYVHRHELDVAAILMLETAKPLSFLGGQLGRVFFGPFLPAFGEDIELNGEKILSIFEKRENVEKLRRRIEELQIEEDKRKREKKALEKAQREEKRKKYPKKGWRRFFPFSNIL